MEYRVAKIFNSNAVLAQDPAENQVVIMSKGIGFGRHPGEVIKNCEENQKVFYILNDNVNAMKIRQLDSDAKKVEQVTHKIVQIAQKRLKIDNDNLYGALVDHITFAIECLHMGLPIDNPFCGEIAILYSQEYETAQIAAEIIKENIGVDIGDAETCFIALHLYSARKKKHIRATMKSTRVYSEILTMVGNSIGKKIKNASAKSFLLSISSLITLTAHGSPVTMSLKQQIRLNMTNSYRTALEVSKLVEKEMNLQLSEDAVAFIAVDIEKLKQF
ncbi:MAG TPA: PRD domain-containing protein [Caproiciproducens sp.]|nr:PRD domain-containing protein [Caproiciproducens sp.]